MPKRELGEDVSPSLDSLRRQFEIATWNSVDLKQALVVMGFPSVGLVGSIATAHLVESLRLRATAAVLSPLLPPTAVVRGGISTSPIRIYLGDMVCGIDGKCDQLCVIHSDIAPKSSAITPLAYTLVSWAGEHNARQLVCLEGSRADSPPEAEAQILGVASDANGRALLDKLGILAFEDGLITGLGGVVLYAARAAKLPALCLLARIHEDYPDARSAARLLEILDPLVPLLPLGAGSLHEKARILEVAFREQLERSSRAMKNLSEQADMMYG